ncbi:MAG: UDP-N-acetylmuramoyl-L-alanyl-D-glutamate--2,6-diaminopimelate ligase [Myxococcota bacterium]
MRLSSLLDALPEALAVRERLRANEGDDPTIRGIRYDSRQVAPGDLFVALRGTNSDGHDFLERAIAAGAAALLVEEAPDEAQRGLLPIAVVPDSRRALAPIATRFYGNPAGEMNLVGVTGTNGKTSTTYLVESILARANQRVGLVGTVEIRYAGTREVAVNTTPESLDLQRTLRAMRTEHVEATVMEVSSHGLELGRVEGCTFKVAAFTNLSQDHLDFHGSMDAYFAAKARLFRDHLAPGAIAVVNVDDAAGEKMAGVARDAGADVLRVARGADADADLRLLDASASLEGTRATLEDAEGRFDVALPLLGDFNLENLLVAVGIGRALGLDAETIASGVAACPQVPGRMERVVGTGRDEPTVLVDYAHTPDAVEKLMRAVRPLCDGRLIAVFGCGGDRDRAKRPLMARAAATHADLAIATSDNPRTEDPVAILADVEAGLGDLVRVEPEALFGVDTGRYSVVVDRRAAIDLAIGGALPGDTVVLAGKGHEDYQIIGREKFPFDDRLEGRRALLARDAGDRGEPA